MSWVMYEFVTYTVPVALLDKLLKSVNFIND